MKKTKFHSLHINDLKLNYISGLCFETISLSAPIVAELNLPLLHKALEKLTATYAIFDNLLNRSRKSPLTADILVLYRQGGRQYAELLRGVSYYSKSSDPTKSAAAQKLLYILEPMWGITYKPLPTKLTLMGILRERIVSHGLLESLATLSLTSIWQQVMETFTTLQQRYQQRLYDHAAAALPAATGMKATIIKDYTSFCTILIQLLRVMPSKPLRRLFLELNALRITFVSHLPKDLGAGAHCVIAPIGRQQYTGKAITPIPTVFYCEKGKPDMELAFAEHFTVTYKSNEKVGMADIIIHGKGAYRGRKMATFNIVEEL
jgi:hypothetical protein